LLFLPVLLDYGNREKEASEVEWNEKPLFLQGQPRTRETETRQFLLINLVLTWGRVSIPHGTIAQRRGDWETEAGEAIRVETEKRKAFWVRTGRMRRMTRARTQGK